MPTLKRIQLCADDFGLSAEISLGVLKLAKNQRLSAVSCMVNEAFFDRYIDQLVPLQESVSIGLHLNLTQGQLFTQKRACFSLNQLLIKTHLHLIDTQLIAKEFNAQLDRFIKITGQPPQFIDGHQHVHQFPQIREIILDMYQKRLRNSQTSMRSTYPMISLPQYAVKTKILALTGGKALHSRLKDLAIPHNPFFSGVYDFKPDTEYRALMRQWLSLAPTGTLIMCHPSQDLTQGDSIAPTRLAEFNYLLSDEFLNDCQEFGVNLASTSPIS